MTFTIAYHDRFESRTEHATVEAASIQDAVETWIDAGGAGWIDVLSVRAEPTDDGLSRANRRSIVRG